jgi:hypothetical protein
MKLLVASISTLGIKAAMNTAMQFNPRLDEDSSRTRDAESGPGAVYRGHWVMLAIERALKNKEAIQGWS